MRAIVLSAFLVFTLSLACFAVFAADSATAAKPAVETKAADKAEVKVSVEAKDSKVKDVLDSLAKQSKEEFVVESSVKGDVASLSLRDVTLESALTTLAKTAKIEWRRIYIAPDSKLLEQPDRLAATVRLMSGLSFPDLVLAGASTNKLGVHFEDKAAVKSAEESATKTLGMTSVYLITNDAAVATRALSKEKEEKNAGLDKFNQMQRDQIEMFMKMTPEEREQALMAGINMMDQVSPEYMSAVMQTLMNSDPENLRRMMNKQMDSLMSMSTDQRRSMMKFQMEAAKSISPEVQKMLQEDAMAIMEEMKAQGKQP
jgi:type II secretory pathway component GspD/PulD (secretin)